MKWLWRGKVLICDKICHQLKAIWFMICLPLNILKLHFLPIYKLQVSIIGTAAHTAMNEIRSLGCRSEQC